MPADVSELLALAAEFDAAGAKVARATVKAVAEATDAGADVARAAAPRRSGTLADSITATVAGAGGVAGAHGTIRANTRYSWYVYAGTSRMAPQPGWMDSGRDAAEQKLGQALEQAVAEALQ